MNEQMKFKVGDRAYCKFDVKGHKGFNGTEH